MKSRYAPLKDRLDHTITDSGCWVWSGYRDKGRYGRLSYRGKNLYAHRVAWEVSTGKSAMGLIIRHICDNPSCINPEHLACGDVQDNVDDRCNRGRSAVGSRQGAAKLTEKDVLEIRATEDKYENIAEMYSVSLCTINYIKQRRSWRHI